MMDRDFLQAGFSASSSAKADDPVFRNANILSRRRGILDARLRGHDELGNR
jgi:hypothetical protein